MKVCPFCTEEIRYEAIVCRYCGRSLYEDEEEVDDYKYTENVNETNYNSQKKTIIKEKKIIF